MNHRTGHHLFPGLEKRKRLKKYLRGLYPGLKNRDFERKLKVKAKGDVRLTHFRFFRTFVTYFFDLLHRLKSDPGFPDLSPVEKPMGWCLGDAHLENFGTIWRQTPGGEARVDFTMNDPEDGGPCPLYADLLRFLTGCLVYRPNQPALPVINAYRRGLEGDEKVSYLVERQLRKAESNGAAPDRPKELTRKYKLRPEKNKAFEIRKKIPKRVAKDLRRKIRKIAGGGYRIKLVWGAKKLRGGSSGMQRFRALLQPKKRTAKARKRDKAAAQKFLVLELKKLGKPGIYPLVCPMPLIMRPITAPACSEESSSIIHRVHETLRMSRDGEVSRFCSVVRIKRVGTMLSRALWKGNNNIKLETIANSAELSVWIEDAAKTLGRLHRRSLPVGSSYPNDIQARAAQLTKAAEQLARSCRQASEILG